jgi:hypothetical protein
MSIIFNLPSDPFTIRKTAGDYKDKIEWARDDDQQSQEDQTQSQIPPV